MGCPPTYAESGDGGVVVGQLLVDRQRLAKIGLRLRQLAGHPTARDRGRSGCHARLLTELSVGGVFVRQLL